MLLWTAVTAVATSVLALAVTATALKWTVRRYRERQRDKWLGTVVPSVVFSVIANALLERLSPETRTALAEQMQAALGEQAGKDAATTEGAA